jgi:hypothetical protein
MPSDKDYTLGFLIDNSALLDTTEIPDGFFRSDKQREVWEVVSKLRAAGEVVNSFTISERCAGNGVVSYVTEITSGIYGIKPDDFRRRVYKQAAEDVQRRMQSLAAADLPDLDEITALAEEARRLYGEAEASTAKPAETVLSHIITGSAMQALDLNVEWTIDSLVPSRSITLLHSRSGLGKTWLCLQAAKAVSEGASIWNLTTKQRPVFYVDYENPLPLMVERTRHLDVRDVNFWHLSATLKPPKLDSSDWTLYKQLPAGSLIFIDTARACQDGDENSSQDVGLVMGRLKEIREQGNEIVLLHHTGKVNDRGYKGSTAWVDLADHVLSLHTVRRGTLEEIDDDGGPDPDALFSLGTGAKTRYAPARIYLRFDPTGAGFTLAEDPDQETLHSIRERIAEDAQGVSQTLLYEWGKSALDLSKKGKLVFLLQKGEHQGLWTSRKNGRTRLYYAG